MTEPTTETSTTESVDDYRARARAWIEQNLDRQGPGGSGRLKPWELEEQTTEELAGQRALQRRLFEAGYAGITWPVEYGGQGLDASYEKAFVAAAAGYSLPDLGIAGGATFGVCAPTMLAHASPEFLRRHIPRVLAGDLIVSQFFSDPDAGSDLAGVRTQAVRDGDRWILSGSKIWSSGAYYADAGMCLARTDWDVPKHRGLTWFLVPTDADGLTIERIRQINGDAEFCQEYLDEVEVADADRIGEVNDGWNVTQTMLLYERGAGSAGGGGTASVGVRADVLGLAEAVGALHDPLARDALARIHVDDLARASLGRRLLARMIADPGNAGNLASYGKLASGVFDPIRANRALEIAGDAAVAWGDQGDAGAAAAVGLLNSRFMAIAGGTSQMQRNTVGERVLGLPREPAFDRTKPFREVVRDSRNWSGAVG
jgi:alkylation response protein AidB-like acyl-CoA dehydrogenase